MAAITEPGACLAFSFSVPVWLIMLEYCDLLSLRTLVRAWGHSPPADLAHTQAFWGVIEAFIQMALSLGSGLTQELLLLVREDCMDASSSLSLCSSATIPPPPLVPLQKHPHFSSVPNSLLLHHLLHHPRISSYFHPFVASVSTDSVNQTEDGQTTAPSVGMGCGESRQGY